MKYILSSVLIIGYIIGATTLLSGQTANTNATKTTIPTYQVGTGIADFTRLLDGSLPHGIGTYGYVHYNEPIDTTKNEPENGIINGVHLKLKARAISIKHMATQKRMVYVLLDLAFASGNIRKGVVEKLRQHDASFESASLILTATHTHSAPGGHSSYMGYEVASPGHKPEIVEVIVQRTYEAILDAWNNESPMQLHFAESTVADSIPIAYSRKSLPGFNSNPEVKNPISIEENYKATDRLWQMIYFEKDGVLHSLLSFFAAHPNRMGADIISSDTRGAASEAAELELPENGLALFAQNAPGDIDSEGAYRKKVSQDNLFVLHPAYYNRDSTGKVSRVNKSKRVLREGGFLKEQAFRTRISPEATFPIEGDIDYELIYVDMSNQAIPHGNYSKTLDPHDYYKNDYFLFGNFGKIGALFRPKIRTAKTTTPAIGFGAIARVDDKLESLVISLERILRYSRLGLSIFKDLDKATYLWEMYRSQGEKTVMLEGGEYISAIGFKIGGPMFDIFSKFDPVLLQFEADSKTGLHKEHTIYPTIVPIQIMILGNVAIAGVSGEPGYIAGQRIEKAIHEHLKHRGVERVIVNGYANENTGYVFTPEEYPSQFAPQQCGFQLYGRWTEPAFRFNFEQLAKAMLVDGEDRAALLDKSIHPPIFSDDWYKKATNLKHIPIEDQRGDEQKKKKTK